MEPASGIPRLYSDLAWLWPFVSPPADYEEESEEFLELIRQSSGHDPETLLHLGCGGGHNDHTFARHTKVMGVDISEAMLGKARALNPEAGYICGDMRSVRLDRRFAAVVALDAMNSMLSEADLRAVFLTAYEHLEPGGVFLTYVDECAERFEQNKTVGSGHSAVHQDSGSILDITFISNHFDPDPTDTTYEATFIYLIREGGGLSIESETNRCGVFPLATWIKLMLETGFDVKQFEYDRDEGALPVLVGVRGT